MNPANGPTANSIALPSRKGLLLRVFGALVAASVIVFLFILPAEYQIDPTHFGKITGLTRMGQGSTPATTAAHSYTKAFRTDKVELSLGADQDYEYKVHMKAGDVLVYSWTSEGPYDYDFHGESDKDPDHAVSYKAGMGQEMHGSLIAPFTGIHGWYWKNKIEKLNTIHLKMAGQYDLIEDFGDPDEPEAQPKGDAKGGDKKTETKSDAKKDKGK